MNDSVVCVDEVSIVKEELVDPVEEEVSPLIEDRLCLSEQEVTDNTVEGLDLLVQEVVQALYQIHQMGDSFVAVITNPSLTEEFTNLFRALPDDVLQPEIRDNLPIVGDPAIQRVRVMTGTDLEMRFLHTRYGPRENGGNGLIQRMNAELEAQRSPVRITTEFLKTYYLMDIANKVSPQIYQPTGSEVLKAISLR